MKILMDADCLIKITKAGIKEKICCQFEVVIPLMIKEEVVDAGKAKSHPDADVVEKNISAGLIVLESGKSSKRMKGDRALLEAFKNSQYTAVATDDAKLTRLLRATGIPFILPALLIFSVWKRGAIDQTTVLSWLEKLSAFISEDEYSMVRLLLEEKK
jgi:rRNA-processing protein FCF1